MRIIKRVTKTLADGQKKTYVYAINGDTRRLIKVTSSVLQNQYRSKEKTRIVASLQANSSLLVVGEGGSGKSFLREGVVEDLEQIGHSVAIAVPATIKQILLSIAQQIGVDTTSIDGKALNAQELQDKISDFLVDNTVFLVFDNAHRLPPSFRSWLEQLYFQGQPMLLLATFPPPKDIFEKLPRMELEPLSDRAIREIMKETAAELKIEVSDARMAELQQWCAGNPMLAQRVIREELLGLDETTPDHSKWVDGTPFLVAALMLLVIIRYVGLGFNSTSLYLIGGIITVAVGVVRIMLYSLPRKSGRLGQ